MHISRNKCELLFESAISGVKPEYDEYCNAYVNGIQINRIVDAYNKVLKYFEIMRDNINSDVGFQNYLNNCDYDIIEAIIQFFYVALNGVAGIDVEEVVIREMKQIIKYREMEEYNYV